MSERMSVPEALEELEALHRDASLRSRRNKARKILDAVWAQACDEGKAGVFEGSPPVVNYVIEASIRGGPWHTWSFAPQSEMIAKHGWRRLLPRPESRTGTRFRLVKRTALTADEVLDTDAPET